MKNAARQPKTGPPAQPAAGRHDPAAALQRDVRRRSADRRRLPDRLSARAARDPGARRLDRRDTQHRRARRAALRRAGRRHQVPAPHRPHRLQGRRARSRAEGRARRVRRDLRRRLHSDDGFPDAPVPHFADPASRMVQARWGHINQDYSLLTKIQAILLDGHFVLEQAGATAAALLQLQRHGRRLAPRRHRRRRRLAARHADRGSRPQLPRAAARLAVRLPAGPDRAGRSAGRDERLQVAAAPLGQGLDPDLHETAAADPAVRPAARRKVEAFFHLTANFNYIADVRALGADVPVHGDPLQHGLVRDAAHRRAAVLRGDVLVLQLLHGLPA